MSDSYVAYSPTNFHTEFFSQNTMSFISNQILFITKNSFLNTPYLVPLNTIKDVMESVWTNFRPNTGDIYSRYTINNETEYRYINYGADMIRQVIAIIVNDIMNTTNVFNNNNSFSVWNTLSGVNQVGLQHYSGIKVNEKRGYPMQFNMNF